MKKRFSLRRLTWSFTYSFGQIFLGLLLHPFQTMRTLVEDKYWLWLALIPLLFLAVAFLLWQIIVWFLTGFLSLSFTFLAGSPLLFFLELLKWWLFYFCFFWQIILLILLVKFILFFKNQQQ